LVSRNDTLDWVRLAEAMKRASLSLRRYRMERVAAVRQYVGQHWSDEGTQYPVPVNLLSLYVQIVARQLVSKAPRVMLSTFDRQMKPVVNAMQAWANDEVERMYLANTLQRVVVDGLFNLGIAKVALATPAESALYGWGLRAGEPFVARVDLDDFVYDVHARDFLEADFIGHRYRVPLDAVKDSKLYDRKATKHLTPTQDDLYNAEGDERINVLGRGTYAANAAEEFLDHVDLWEVYLPRHRLVVTLADDHLAGAVATEPLRVQHWLGPKTGPYHPLCYQIVPGNAMPKGPLMDLIDLHHATNDTMRKLMRTVERIKEVGLVEGGSMEDAYRINQADDGETVKCDRKFAQAVFSGQAVPVLHAMTTAFKDLFAYAAGNLDMMGGLAPQSKTASQDRMLSASASGGVQDLQERTVEHTTSVLKALCWYWYYHPGKVMTSSHTVPGLPGVGVTRHVTPAMRRQGRFEDLGVKVDPYSMRHQTPESRMQMLSELMQQVLLPMMPLLQQSGITIDLNAWLQKYAAYMDMPDLADVVTIAEPPPADSQVQQPEAAAKATNTTRRYVRENRSSETGQAQDQNRITSLLGVNTGGNPNKNGQPMGVK
jgi:hypothetical protein